jgi:hypothetical protein
MANEQELQAENKKIRYLRIVVDLSLQQIVQGDLTLDQVFDLVEQVRKFALRLFPGKEYEFDLIYRPRFQRAIRGCYPMH